MGKIIGIDDAGRGPVIGPMVLAGVLMDKNEEAEVKSYGAKDSKLLTPAIRKKIGIKVAERFDNFVVTSSPKEIDESTNLNYLEAIKTATIINKLMEGLNERVKVIVDCPSVNIVSWQEDVWKLLENQKNVELSCEHKADANHPVVSAASILAKERREEEIEILKNTLDVDFGSGYPSDPKTKEFIRENYNNEKYKEIIRFSWNTVKKLYKEAGQKSLF